MATVMFLDIDHFFTEVSSEAITHVGLIVRLQTYHRQRSQGNMPIFDYTSFVEAGCEIPDGDTLICRVEIGSLQILSSPSSNETDKIKKLEFRSHELADYLLEKLLTERKGFPISVRKGLLAANDQVQINAPDPGWTIIQERNNE